MDRRDHHRVQLRIPARLRWTTPLGQKTEVCDTLNVSRGGVLVPCAEHHEAGTTLWVTFPYDSSLPFGQPEILARVVRSGSFEPSSLSAAKRKVTYSGNGGRTRSAAGAEKPNELPTLAAALQFNLAPRTAMTNGNGRHREVERRKSPRRLVALPIRVRQEHVPWFEETMTLDVSAESVRFRSNREYAPDQHLIVSFEPSAALPWPGAEDFRSLVVRVDPVPQSPALAVTIYRIS